MRNIKNLGLSALLLGVGAIVGCGEEEPDFKTIDYTIEKYNVDQVFAGSYGYTVLKHDKSGEVSSELFYYRGWLYGNKLPLPMLNDDDKKKSKGIEKADKHVRVFKDLDEKEKGYVEIARYKYEYFGNNNDVCYAEIHLQKNQSISPGQEIIQIGKRTENKDLEEVK